MLNIQVATAGDMAALTTLASAAPPEVISVPDEWVHRVGDGTDGDTGNNLTLLASWEGNPVGFLWADNSMRVDYRLPLSWVCLNALYVDPGHRDNGVGAALVTAAVTIADDLGCDLVHGVCLPEVSGWWASLEVTGRRFTVLGVDEAWPSPVLLDGKRLDIVSAGNCALWMWLVEPREYSFTPVGRQ